MTGRQLADWVRWEMRQQLKDDPADVFDERMTELTDYIKVLLHK